MRIARLADPDEQRGKLRQALEDDDRKELLRLAESQLVVWLSPATLIILADGLQRTGDAKRGLPLLREGQRRHPDDFWINHQLGSVSLNTKPAQVEDAIRFFTAAVALRPKSPYAHLNLGVALGEKGSLAEAVACFRQAIALKPVLPEAHYNLGTALQEQGKLAEAEAAYRKAIALKPDFAAAHSNLGNALREQGKLAEAEAVYRKAIALQPDFAECHYNLGVFLHQQGKLAEAAAAFRNAVALKSDFALAHYNLGLALGKQGKLAEAEAAYRKAIALKPDLAEAHCNLGHTLRDCPIRWQLRIMGYENTSLSQRHHRRPVGAVRASHSCLPRRATAQDQPARRRRCHLLCPANRLPVEIPAQGLPAQEYRLAVLRRVAAQRHSRHHP